MFRPCRKWGCKTKLRLDSLIGQFFAFSFRLFSRPEIELLGHQKFSVIIGSNKWEAATGVPNTEANLHPFVAHFNAALLLMLLFTERPFISVTLAGPNDGHFVLAAEDS